MSTPARLPPTLAGTAIGRIATQAAETAEAQPSTPTAPAWYRAGRSDRAAERHGLNLHERDALSALTAEAFLISGPIAGGDEVWAEIAEAGPRWPTIRKKLERRGRIRIDVPDPSRPETAILTVIYVAERLAEAAGTVAQARAAGVKSAIKRLRP